MGYDFLNIYLWNLVDKFIYYMFLPYFLIIFIYRFDTILSKIFFMFIYCLNIKLNKSYFIY